MSLFDYTVKWDGWEDASHPVALHWFCEAMATGVARSNVPGLKVWKDQADSRHLRCLSGSVALSAAEWKKGMLWSLFLNKSPRYLKGFDNTIYSSAKPKPTTHQVPWWLAVFFLPPRMCSALCSNYISININMWMETAPTQSIFWWFNCFTNETEFLYIHQSYSSR